MSTTPRWLQRFAARFQRPRHAVLFVIPGASGGFPAVNVELYRRKRAFRNSIDSASVIVEEVLGWNAAAAYRDEREPPSTVVIARRNEMVQHGLTRIALIDAWLAEGIVPDAALGVSMGEVIAPYAAGAISRRDCAKLVTVVAQAVAYPVSAFRTYVIAADDETARRLCRSAPVRCDFLGASSTTSSLVLGREDDRAVLEVYLDSLILKTAASGWPYHTPAMQWDHDWAHAELGDGIALEPGPTPIYSSAVGGVLPGDTRFNSRFLHWAMSGPCHFVRAVSTALSDGLDVAVQVAGKPMHFFADVEETARAQGCRVRQVEAIDLHAINVVRRMRRRSITPRSSTSEAAATRPHIVTTCEAPRLSMERLSERLLQPLVDGVPFDIISALADPIADAVTVDRDELRRLLASAVLVLLRDDLVRQAVTEEPERLSELVGSHASALAAASALLRLAPDVEPFQPLNTACVNGEILQLVIIRKRRERPYDIDSD